LTADSEENSEASYKKSSLNKNESSLGSESENDSENSSNESGESEENSSENSDESQKGGLSIFPFNSSAVKSSVTEKKNKRMIRRKI